MSLEYVHELTKTMYRLSFRLPDSKVKRHVLLGMSTEQNKLVDLTQN